MPGPDQLLAADDDAATEHPRTAGGTQLLPPALVDADPIGGPAGPGPARRFRRGPRLSVRRVVLAAVLALIIALAWSIGHALTAPGTDTVPARLAEWGRDHGASPLIDAAERWRYRQHPPRTGGAPAGGIPTPMQDASAAAAAATGSGASGASSPGSGASGDRLTRRPPTIRPLPPVPTVVSPPLADEGQWRVLASVAGRPAVQAAFLRPDATHTSYLAGVAYLDPHLVRFELHPGTQEPGHGPWEVPTSLSGERKGLLAAFNSGFRLAEAQGGYYADGRTVGTLRAGSASLIVDNDGTATVGEWGRDASMGPTVAAVRQNLALLVDGGRAVAGIDDNAGHKWGATLGNKLYVARSGVGVTATGGLVYVSGSSLSAGTLADLLARAGCQRAMELDINPDWTSFSYYPPDSPDSGAQKLLPSMQRPANRYETTSTRDFVAVFAR